MKKNYFQISSLLLLLTGFANVAVFSQVKAAAPAPPTPPVKAAPSVNASVNTVNKTANTAKETTRVTKEANNADRVRKENNRTEAARKAAETGNKAHKNIETNLVKNKVEKRRNSEVRMSDRLTRQGQRPDIISKQKRPFEIKPETSSGLRRGREQIKRYETTNGKRGSLILYDPKTGKYKYERTPYREWKNRQREMRPLERPREVRPREVRRRGVVL